MSNKVSLLTLAGSGRDVTLRGGVVTVTGVSARGLSTLFRRFPVLASAVTGGGLDLAILPTLGPDVIAAILAAGTGLPGNEEAEASADALPLTDQLALLEAIISETFAGDPQGFLERLVKLAAGAGAEIVAAKP